MSEGRWTLLPAKEAKVDSLPGAVSLLCYAFGTAEASLDLHLRGEETVQYQREVDEHLGWFMEHITEILPMLDGVPAVRQHMLARLMTHSHGGHSRLAKVVLLGLADVWSDTRKKCAKALFKHRIPAELVHDGLLELVQSDTWQSCEGGLRGIVALIHAHRLLLPEESTSSLASALAPLMHEDMLRALAVAEDWVSLGDKGHVRLAADLLPAMVLAVSRFKQPSVAEVAAEGMVALAGNSHAAGCGRPVLHLARWCVKQLQECTAHLSDLLAAIDVLQGLLPYLPRVVRSEVPHALLPLLSHPSSTCRQAAARAIAATREIPWSSLISLLSSAHWEAVEGSLFVLEEALLTFCREGTLSVHTTLESLEEVVYAVSRLSTERFEIERMCMQVAPPLAEAVCRCSPTFARDRLRADDLSPDLLNSYAFKQAAINGCGHPPWGVGALVAQLAVGAAALPGALCHIAYCHFSCPADLTNLVDAVAGAVEKVSPADIPFLAGRVARILPDSAPRLAVSEHAPKVAVFVVSLLRATREAQTQALLIEALRRMVVARCPIRSQQPVAAFLFATNSSYSPPCPTEAKEDEWCMRILKGKVGLFLPQPPSAAAPLPSLLSVVRKVFSLLFPAPGTEVTVSRALLEAFQSTLTSGKVDAKAVASFVTPVLKRLQVEGLEIRDGELNAVQPKKANHKWDESSSSEDEVGGTRKEAIGKTGLSLIHRLGPQLHSIAKMLEPQMTGANMQGDESALFQWMLTARD